MVFVYSQDSSKVVTFVTTRLSEVGDKQKYVTLAVSTDTKPAYDFMQHIDVLARSVEKHSLFDRWVHDDDPFSGDLDIEYSKHFVETWDRHGYFPEWVVYAPTSLLMYLVDTHRHAIQKELFRRQVEGE